jgi:hypothetical protein
MTKKARAANGWVAQHHEQDGSISKIKAAQWCEICIFPVRPWNKKGRAWVS